MKTTICLPSYFFFAFLILDRMYWIVRIGLSYISKSIAYNVLTASFHASFLLFTSLLGFFVRNRLMFPMVAIKRLSRSFLAISSEKIKGTAPSFMADKASFNMNAVFPIEG